jgi:ABC-type branched-subunit amino acid transport system substrate-binding protein
LEVLSEEFAVGTSDFRTQILRFKGKNIDSLLLNPSGDLTLIPMLKQLRQAPELLIALATNDR